MELRIIFPILSLFSSGFIHTAVPAALSEASLTRHTRTKRCSCSTFLDKECVYFCHLDIIWVNTPERTVSYGLGSAPRKKRSVEEASLTTELTRCVCTDSTDGTCLSFCHKIKLLRYKTTRDKVIPTASGPSSVEKQSKYDLAAKNLGINSAIKNPAPSNEKARRQLPLLLKKWTVKLPQKEQILPTSRHMVLDFTET